MNRRTMMKTLGTLTLLGIMPELKIIAADDKDGQGKEKAEEKDDVLERQMALLMKEDSNQKRPRLIENSILARVARQRAADMGRRGYFSHVTPEGEGPNILVAKAGYPLPSSWTSNRSANYIETIAAGAAMAEETWRIWMESPAHRGHILATNSFYANQVEYGIGHASIEGSQYGHYWVVLTAYPARN